MCAEAASRPTALSAASGSAWLSEAKGFLIVTLVAFQLDCPPSHGGQGAPSNGTGGSFRDGTEV